MKRLLLICMTLMTGLVLSAQERYLDTVFQEVTITENVKYGRNYTVLTVPVVGKATSQNLLMDVYEPTEDTIALRPLVLVFHTGNFLPYPQSGGVSGSKDNDMASIEFSNRLAKMGYVAANVDYRLGWNPLSTELEERTSTLINAAYRGVQDCRTAIRYFKKDVEENGNTYGIDTSRIVVWGVGTGGYISLNSAVLDNYTDILIPKFFGSDITGDGNPDPMVIQQFHGDIYGTSLALHPSGDTLSLPNHVGYNSDFHLTVNIGGAMGDTSWLDASDGPFISVHVPTDPFAPYKEFTLIVPTTGEQVVEVQGSYLVDSLANAYGNNQVMADLELDDEITKVAKSRRGDIAGLLPLIGSGGVNDSAPWTYWDKENNVNSESSLVGNPDMSKEKANRYIDSIMMFYAPRAYAVLQLGELSYTENLKMETGLRIYPNIVAHDCIIETDLDHPFEAIYLYDQQGRMMKRVQNIRTTRYTLDMSDMPSGLYFARVMTKAGSSVSRIIKQ